MGFFNFSKKEKRTDEPQKMLADFFKADIVNVFNYEVGEIRDPETGVFNGDKYFRTLLLDSVSPDGISTKLWLLHVPESKTELGIFTSIGIRQFDNSLTDFNLSFSADSVIRFPLELIRIIQYMTDKYGHDNLGKGYVTEQEVNRVVSGNFWTGRFWADHMTVSYGMSNEHEWELNICGNPAGK